MAVVSDFVFEVGVAMTTNPEVLRLARAPETKCKWCASTPVREVLDGEPLCQACCVRWCRSERFACCDTDELDELP